MRRKWMGAPAAPRAAFHALFVAGLAAPLAAPPLLTAQQASPAAQATPPAQVIRVAAAGRPSTPAVVDGRLDEAVWQQAEPLSGFVQRIPFDGRAASEPTEVRVLSDASAIYVGVWLFDSEPARIVDGESIRDASLNDSDAVLLVFDTYKDGRNGFVFGSNPSGIEFDGQVANEGEGGGGGGAGPGSRQQGGAGGGFNQNWDGSWDVATSRDERGWYAEFRIPFSTLRYRAGEEQEWGFNVARRIRRHNEESTWSPVPRQYTLYRVSYAGTLGGITPAARSSATVTPYLLGSAQRDWIAGNAQYLRDGDVGADVKVQLAQGMTLDLTYNTDFAQVEVDEAQLNLTRFSIRFPEKRPFFLENSGLFTLGNQQAELFFSRRIGIVSGREVPIQGGGRLSGRVAGLNVGVLHIRTEDAGDLAPSQSYSVARVARELPNRSRVGGIFVDKDVPGSEQDDNRTYGVDGQLGIGENLTLSSFAGWTDTPGLDGKNHVASASAVYAARSLRLNANYREVGDAFNPEAGFAQRVNYRYWQGMWMAYVRPSRILREIRPHMSFETFRNLGTGFEQTARVHVDSHFEFPSGAFISPAFDYVTEGLERPFVIEGVTVPAGTYQGWNAAWRFNTDRSAALSFDGGIDWGSYLSGEIRGGFGSLSYRLGSAFTTSIRYTYNDVNLAGGEFLTRLTTWRAGYFFTPRIYVQSLVQYSDQADTWGANLRFGWLNTAGTGLFVVFNEARGVGLLERDTPLNRGVILKFTRQFNAWGGE